MLQFTSTIHQFEKQGEKTGWTYIEIPADIAGQLSPKSRKSFRVKGKLDKHSIAGVALLPMGSGIFIMPLNAAMRKAIRKKKGAILSVKLAKDEKVYQLNKEFMECLCDEPPAQKFFSSFPVSVQNYYSKWIETAKTEETKARRIALAINSLSKKMDFGEMLRSHRKESLK